MDAYDRFDEEMCLLRLRMALLGRLAGVVALALAAGVEVVDALRDDAAAGGRTRADAMTTDRIAHALGMLRSAGSSLDQQEG